MTNVKSVSLFPDIQQKKAIAQALIATGTTPVQANMMAGNVVVPVNPWGEVAKVGSAALGGYLSKKANEQEQEQMAKLFRGGQEGGVPWTNPDTGQQMPMTNSGGGAGPLSMPGMSPDKAQALYKFFPEQYAAALMKNYEPTDKMRNNSYMGITPEQERQMEIAERRKAGTQQFTPGSTIQDPTGKLSAVPDFEKGIVGRYGPNGPSASSIPGAIEANAAMTGANKRAQELNTVNTYNINGREGVPAMTSDALNMAGNQLQERGARPAQWNDQNDPGLEPTPGKRPLIGQSESEKSFSQASGTMQTKVLEKSQDAALAAKEMISSIELAEDALQQGAFSGPGSSLKMSVIGAAKTMGIDLGDPKKFTNSVTLGSALGHQMLANVKKLGVNPTDEDRKVVQGILGTIDTDPQAMKRLLAWNRNQAIRVIASHNSSIDKAERGGFQPAVNLRVDMNTPTSMAPSNEKRVIDFNSLPD